MSGRTWSKRSRRRRSIAFIRASRSTPDRTVNRVGALTDIRGTPWSVWVEFPQAVILAPARAFLERMSLIALGFVVLSALGIRMIAARITTPLQELTLASEAVASGDYARRVTILRRDELGRLSVAFNAMTQQGRERASRPRRARSSANRETRRSAPSPGAPQRGARRRQSRAGIVQLFGVARPARAAAAHHRLRDDAARSRAAATLDGEGQRLSADDRRRGARAWAG